MQKSSGLLMKCLRNWTLESLLSRSIIARSWMDCLKFVGYLVRNLGVFLRRWISWISCLGNRLGRRWLRRRDLMGMSLIGFESMFNLKVFHTARLDSWQVDGSYWRD